MFGRTSDTAKQIEELQHAVEGANIIVAMLVKRAGGKVVIPFNEVEAISADAYLAKSFQPNDDIVLELVDHHE